MAARGITKRERCPGTGAYARDRAGNPSASCPVCGSWRRLTKRGTIYRHTRIVQKQRVQRQDSLDDQLRGLVQIANREGMYDAADWIRDLLACRLRTNQETLNFIERITDGS